jgi:hypothetical protein
MVISDMPRKNTSLEYVWNKYVQVYRKRLGSNYWAVYNALTDWSTHFGAVRSSGAENIASIQNDRQQVVRDAVKNNLLMKVA